MEGLIFRTEPKKAFLMINNETGLKTDSFKMETYPHGKVWDRLVKYLSSIGFTVGPDETVDQCIRKYNIRGIKGDLQLKGEIYPSGARIEFFQNIIHDNPHGGEYDFDKYEKMPYLIRKEMINTCDKVKAFLIKEGLAHKPKFIPKTAEEFIKARYVEEWHHPQKDMDFNLSDLDGETCECQNNGKDREGNPLKNGETKYFRDRRGYLAKGKIYHNINNMWWVALNKTDVTNIASFELFDLTDQEPRIRVRPRKIPKNRVERIESLQSLSDKDLLAELRRRKIKING